jgi:hypothetical protein
MLRFGRVLALFLMAVGGTVFVAVLIVTAGLLATHKPAYEPGSLAMHAASVLGIGAAVWLLSRTDHPRLGA